MELRKAGGIVILLAFFLLVGCQKTTAPLTIKEFGPVKTKAGQGFNVQPDGGSALWIKADNVTDATIIIWDEKPLRTFKESYGVSAPVPADLYSKPGQSRIYLLDTKSGAKSNIVLFSVEE